MKNELEIRKVLDRLRKFETEQGHLIEEMYGEIYALEYVLEERDDLF